MTSPTPNQQPSANSEPLVERMIERPDYRIYSVDALQKTRWKHTFKTDIAASIAIGEADHGCALFEQLTALSGKPRFNFKNPIVRMFCCYLHMHMRKDTERGEDPLVGQTPSVQAYIEDPLYELGNELRDISPFPAIYLGIQNEVEHFATKENVPRETAIFVADFLLESLLPYIDNPKVAAPLQGRESLREVLINTPFKFCGANELPLIADIEIGCKGLRVEELVTFMSYLSYKCDEERTGTSDRGIRNKDLPRAKEILLIVAEIIKKRFLKVLVTAPEEKDALKKWLNRFDGQVVQKLSEPWQEAQENPDKAWDEIKKMKVGDIPGLIFGGRVTKLVGAFGRGVSEALKQAKPAAQAMAEGAAHGAGVAVAEEALEKGAKAAGRVKGTLKGVRKPKSGGAGGGGHKPGGH